MAVAGPGRAQELNFALRPGPANVAVTKDVPYGRSDTVTLRMDVYRPSDAAEDLKALFPAR